MANEADEPSNEQLKATIRKIVVGQGNRFVKELLRDNQIKIGSTKSEFLENTLAAVDDGLITAAMIENWLAEIEGWGNQHIYLLEPLNLTPTAIIELVEASDFKDHLDRPATHDFPDELRLSSITIHDNTLRLTWYRGNDRWTHVKTKDYKEEEGMDLYEYRAFLQRSYRTVVRYEWRLDSPYSAIFMQLPNVGSAHADCIDKIWEVLNAIKLKETPPEKLVLSDSVNSFSVDTKSAKASGRTMWAEGGRVNFISNSLDLGIGDIEALRNVDSAIDPSLFQSADGRFHLDEKAHKTLSRPIHVEVYGSQGRVRIGVQCKREDVCYLTDLVWEKNNT